VAVFTQLRAIVHWNQHNYNRVWLTILANLTKNRRAIALAKY